MSLKGMSLRERIDHYAKQNGIAAQVVLQKIGILIQLLRRNLSMGWTSFQDRLDSIAPGSLRGRPLFAGLWTKNGC